jgi:hypothetical protein
MVSLPYIAPQYQTTDAAKKAAAFAREIKDLKAKLNANGGPKSRMEKYNKGTPEYDKALTEFNTLNSKIQNLEKQDAQNNLSSIKSRLDKARDRGDTAQVTTLQQELDRLKGVINNPASYDPKVSGPQYVAGDEFGNAIREKGLSVVTDANGKSYLSSSLAGYEGNNNEHYVYVSDVPTAGGKDTNVDIAYSYTEIEKKILSEAAKKPGGVDNLLGKLYKAGLIKRDTYQNRLLESDDFTTAMRYALKEYSKKTVRDYEVGGTKTPLSFDSYLDSNLKASGPQVSYDAQVTTRDTAASDLDRFFIQFVGRGASKQEHDEYYKQLRAAEKKAVVSRATSGSDSGGGNTTTTGEFLNSADILEMQRKVAGKALVGSDIDTVLKSGAGAAQTVNQVLSYAKNYGIALSSKDAMAYVADQLKAGQTDPEAIKSKLVAISKATYTNLSDSLSDQVSLKELSGNYIYDMSRVLELNQDSIDVLDPTIQAALKNNGNKGMMNLTEFDKMLRNDGRWSKTRNAREEAAKYAYDILQDFGLMA